MTRKESRLPEPLREAEGLVHFWAYKLERLMPPVIGREDLVQVALFAVWRSREKLATIEDERHRTRYLSERIVGAMLDERRKVLWGSRDSLDEEAARWGSFPSTDLMTAPESGEPTWHERLGEAPCPSRWLALAQALSKVSARAAGVVSRLVEGASNEEAAAAVGVSPSRASQLAREFQDTIAEWT